MGARRKVSSSAEVVASGGEAAALVTDTDPVVSPAATDAGFDPSEAPSLALSLPGDRGLTVAERMVVLERRSRIHTLLLSRMPPREIARALNVKVSLVEQDIKAIELTLAGHLHEQAARFHALTLDALDSDEHRLRRMMALLEPKRLDQNDADAMKQYRSSVFTALEVYDRILKVMDHRERLFGVGMEGNAIPITGLSQGGEDGTLAFVVSPEEDLGNGTAALLGAPAASEVPDSGMEADSEAGSGGEAAQ